MLILTITRHFDVVGIFSRSLADLHHIVSNTMDLSDTTFPSRAIYPLDFFPHSNPQHQAMFEDFIGILENFLGTKRIEIRLAERWAKCPPVESNGKSLKEYLSKVSFCLCSWAIILSCDVFYFVYRALSGLCATITIMASTNSVTSIVRNTTRNPTKAQS